MTALATTIDTRTDVPPTGLKASFDALRKEVTALAPKLALPPAGRGGRWRGRGARTTRHHEDRSGEERP